MNQFPKGAKEVIELMNKLVASVDDGGINDRCEVGVYWPSSRAEGIPNIIEIKDLMTSVVRKSAYYLDASETTFYSIGSSRVEYINLRDGGAREDYWGYECKENGKDFKVIFIDDDKLFQIFADSIEMVNN